MESVKYFKMKCLLSILILLGFISTSNAGIFDFLKSDESFCIDTLVANDIREVTAANECTNPVPTQSCMKRVYKDLRERRSSADRSIWVTAARSCRGKL